LVYRDFITEFSLNWGSCLIDFSTLVRNIKNKLTHKNGGNKLIGYKGKEK